MIKTNAMRILDKANIAYEPAEYQYDENDLNGLHVAEQIKIITPQQCFKTLVARGEKKGILVFCVPVTGELNLKSAAICAGDKKVELIHVKELQGLTGYIRGGCSPVGMKKKYPTFFDSSAQNYDKIGLSGGMRGVQIIINPIEVAKFIDALFFELSKESNNDVD